MKKRVAKEKRVMTVFEKQKLLITDLTTMQVRLNLTRKDGGKICFYSEEAQANGISQFFEKEIV